MKEKIMRKWILIVITSLLLAGYMICMLGCEAGFSVGPNENPYSSGYFDTTKAQTE